jgi:hypothetical protein
MRREHARAAVALVGVVAGLLLARPLAAIEYGPLVLSGALDSQTLLRSPSIDEWQFVQNRNTALLRAELTWFQNGRFLDRVTIPGLSRSKLTLLYRGVYDSFWDIGPGGRQRGVTRFDDLVGGPVSGNRIGRSCTAPSCVCPPDDPACNALQPGLYTRISRDGRDTLMFENQLREAYVDVGFSAVPLSLRLGRQQVVWGESDQFRLMDVINPLDLTWHLQQEEFDKLRIPLWLIKATWDFDEIGPLSSVFAEVVWNPGDFQPGSKVRFLPSPWSAPVPDPVRSGQILVIPQLSEQLPFLTTPQFDLQGTSIRKGDFDRSVSEASDVGVRLHGIADIAALHLEGFEFTLNYFYGRSRGIGAAAGAPFALKIEGANVLLGSLILQEPGNPASVPALFEGQPVAPTAVTAQFAYPYTNIVGTTANYFEGELTNAVLRLEMAYQFGAPFQSAATSDRPIVTLNGIPTQFRVPLGYTRRDIWAGMIGADRPTWIRWLNPRTTWFLTGQFFWSYINGGHSALRGQVVSAGESPYYNPPASTGLPGNGVGLWQNGPFAGQTERTQDAMLVSSNDVRQWELLATLAATTFYASGTVVPFVALAIDPVNSSLLCQLRLEYLLTDNLVLQLRENLYTTFGSNETSLDPWGVGGLNARRDETGVVLRFQF